MMRHGNRKLNKSFQAKIALARLKLFKVHESYAFELKTSRQTRKRLSSSEISTVLLASLIMIVEAELPPHESLKNECSHL